MAVFKPGQRVKCVNGPATGSVGTFIRYEKISGPVLGTGWNGTLAIPKKDCDCLVDYDGAKGNPWYCASCNLVPLQPERNEKVKWEECPWRPEHLRNVEELV